MRTLIAAFAVAIPCLAAPAQAEITRHIAQMFCGPTAEVEASLGVTHKKVFQGQSGSTSDREGQIWIDAQGGYFVIQRMKSENLSCVVLGGSNLKKVQGQGDT